MAALLADLPDVDAFPTVDEMLAFTARLRERFPDRVQVREVGRSRQGDPLQLVTIAPPEPRGSVLVVGQPHPNEPIGMATIVTLCERLAADPEALAATGAAWHFVPCADPDGTRLNEGWFAGPWTREHYARNFYRPPGETQVEWTFPFRSGDFVVDAPMPETRGLMAALDEVQPDVLVSLHNGELGGAYYYASEGAPALYDRLAAVCEEYGVPLHLGDPETPLSTELAPAVFTVPTAQQIYEIAVTIGADPAAMVTGSSSMTYAEQYKEVFGLVIELPYWRDQRAADTTPDPAGGTRREVMIAGLDLGEESSQELRRLYAAASPLPDSPFGEAVRSFLQAAADGWSAGTRQQILADPSLDVPATVADAFSTRDNVHMSRLRLGGMLLRALPADSPARAEVERVFSDWAAEAAADNKSEVIPIRDLVAVQGKAILATVEHVLGR